jgi:hypothetical protein
MRLDLLKIVSAMVVVGLTGRLVIGEEPTRETRWAAMHFDLLTVVSTWSSSGSSLGRWIGERKGRKKRVAGAMRRWRISEGVRVAVAFLG